MATANVVNNKLEGAYLNGDSNIFGDFKDSNGNKILGFIPTGSAVNYLQITNAATTDSVIIEPVGTDTDIGIIIRAKGANLIDCQSAVMFTDVISSNYRANSPTTGDFVVTEMIAADNSVNYVKINATATGNNPILEVAGTDADRGLIIALKGTGNLQVDGPASARDWFLLDQPGTNQNSPPLQFKGDNGNVEIEGTIQLMYGADPYLRISVDNQGTGTPALTAVLDIKDTILSFVTDNTVDIGGAEDNRPKNIYAVGTITAAAFSGALTGNVTGNCSGSSGTCTGNAGTVTNGVYTTDGGTVTAKMLQNAAADLGAADVNIVLSNTNGAYVTNLTIDGTFSGALTGNVTGNCSGSSGSCSGNAATVTNGVYTTTTNYTITKLATVTGIDAKTAASTDLYTCPGGSNAVITQIVVRCTAADTVSVTHSASIGNNATDYDNWMAITLSGLDTPTTGKMYIMERTGGCVILGANDHIYYKITTGATATSQTLAIEVFGYTY